MAEPEVPQGELTKEQQEILMLNAPSRAPHVMFDREQYEKDVRDGLISLSRTTTTLQNRSPYTPTDIKESQGAMTVAPVGNVKPVVIAITIAYHWPAAYLQACMNDFCHYYNLPTTTLEVIQVGTATTGLTESDLNTNIIAPLKDYIDTTSTSTIYFSTSRFFTAKSISSANQGVFGWLSEILLDICWAHAMNTNAHIRVVEACGVTMGQQFDAVRYASLDSNFTANIHGPTNIVSMSWGGPEGMDFPLSDPTVFTNDKICYLGSTGDFGMSTYPSTSPNVLAVGGTMLKYDTATSSWNQTMWGNTYGGGPASGAGFAKDYAKPTYQTGLNDGIDKRCTPDICGVGDPETGVNIMYTGSSPTLGASRLETQTGGTSASCPINAGLLSHLIQKYLNETTTKLTTLTTNGMSLNLQTLLYTNYTAHHSTMFYDVTEGKVMESVDNTTLGLNNSGKTFTAGVGYDIPSGLGVPLWTGIRNVLFPATPTPNAGRISGTIATVNGSLAFVLTVS
jgi:hypothetical protein